MRRARSTVCPVLCLLGLVLGATASGAQSSSPSSNQMPGMQMGQASTQARAEMAGMPGMQPQSFTDEVRQHAGAGTTAEPSSTPMAMLMEMKSGWMLMFHANVFILDTQQSSARGGDKFFSTNWFMPMAQHALGPGQLTLRGMFSLEPATITGERYPLLFQQGETAYGKPIVDGQHPHDLFMELAAIYDLPLGERTVLTVYLAPVGDPAIGPAAYAHRASASEDPVATLGHHQEDSTHISDDVVTVGLTSGIARIEASGFHGREPDEHRWNIDQGGMDSWSTRLTLVPGRNWSGQWSYARIASIEGLFPAEDQERMTASVMYNRPLQRGNWASTLVWGRTRSLSDSAKENSYLLESTLRFKDRNAVWARLENAGRTTELLNGEQPLPPALREEPLTHVQAYTAGYDRELELLPHVASALGGQVTWYGVGQPLRPLYGSHPAGVSVFMRLRASTH